MRPRHALVVLFVCLSLNEQAEATCDSNDRATLIQEGIQLYAANFAPSASICFNRAKNLARSIVEVETRQQALIDLGLKWADSLDGVHNRTGESIYAVLGISEANSALDVAVRISDPDRRKFYEDRLSYRIGFLYLALPTGQDLALEAFRRVDVGYAHIILAGYLQRLGAVNDLRGAASHLGQAVRHYSCTNGAATGCLPNVEYADHSRAMLAMVLASLAYLEYGQASQYVEALGSARELLGADTPHGLASPIMGWLIRYGVNVLSQDPGALSGFTGLSVAEVDAYLQGVDLDYNTAAIYMSRNVFNVESDGPLQFMATASNSIYFGLTRNLILGEMQNFTSSTAPEMQLLNWVGPTTTSASLTLAVTLTHGGALKSARIIANGPDGDPINCPDVSCSRNLSTVGQTYTGVFEIPLTQFGEYSFNFEATSINDESARMYTTDRTIERINFNERKAFRKAFLLGVDVFLDPAKHDNLPIAEDLNLMRDLIEEAGEKSVFSSHIIKEGPEVTPDLIREIQREIDNDSVIDEYLIYFTGHGDLNDDKKPCFYLNEEDGSIICEPVERILDDLFATPATRVAVIIDSCHSGGWRRGDIIFARRNDENHEHIVWTAVRANQRAPATPDGSIFTQTMVNIATNFASDLDRYSDVPDGFLHLFELEDRVRARMRAMKLEPSRDSDPSDGTKFPLTRLTDQELSIAMIDYLLNDAVTQPKRKACLSSVRRFITATQQIETDRDLSINAIRNSLIDFARLDQEINAIEYSSRLTNLAGQISLCN